MEKNSESFENLLYGYEHEETVEADENYDYDYELENISVENGEEGNGEPIAKKRCNTFKELCRFDNEETFGEWLKNSTWARYY
jgi:hypothetical protein